MDRHLELVNWNVKGLNHLVKKRKVFSHLKQLKAEIAFLHETHIRSSDTGCLWRWLRQGFHSSFQAKSWGVLILFSQHISFKPNNVISDRCGRYIIVSGKLFNTRVVFINVYALNVDDVGFFERLFSSLPDLSTYSLIFGGDFNCWLDLILDRSSTNPGVASRLACYIQNFLRNYGVCDEWRLLHPSERYVHHTI